MQQQQNSVANFFSGLSKIFTALAGIAFSIALLLTCFLFLRCLWDIKDAPTTPRDSEQSAASVSIEEKMASLQAREQVRAPDERVEAFRDVLDTLVYYCSDGRTKIADMIYAAWTNELKEEEPLIQWAEAVASAGKAYGSFLTASGSYERRTCAEPIAALIVSMRDGQ